MDWLHILYVCFVWIVGVVVIGIGLYVVVMLPFMIIGFLVGCVYSVIRFFLPFLPDFWAETAKPANTSGKGFNWGERTEADKHRDLVERIRIQHMNEERNRR